MKREGEGDRKKEMIKKDMLSHDSVYKTGGRVAVTHKEKLGWSLKVCGTEKKKGATNVGQI